MVKILIRPRFSEFFGLFSNFEKEKQGVEKKGVTINFSLKGSREEVVLDFFKWFLKYFSIFYDC